jgi:hypothetical protein
MNNRPKNVRIVDPLSALWIEGSDRNAGQVKEMPSYGREQLVSVAMLRFN